MHTIAYNSASGCARWTGISLSAGDAFSSFLAGEVSARLNDETGKTSFATHLTGLASTGFAIESLGRILGAESPEERDWAVGEALAEAWLTNQHGVVWPWNMDRDKRTPKASLPGADLIGFVTVDNRTCLALGEVKSSSDTSTPPNVMNGRKGMTQQLEALIANLSLLYTLVRWLQARCHQTAVQTDFDAAIRHLLESGNKAIALFGVLVRDTQPNELDLKKRATKLGRTIASPTACDLIALYLPCTVQSLPDLVKQGGSS
ncbi:hypothetical protein [Dyella subtropica]|uniref:hypothetical protein n=1 Tax=Dyella subtropica TaxID=2992127 RepID=UPI002252F618|nr:hypothetical protein [Dyella subtropica]